MPTVTLSSGRKIGYRVTSRPVNTKKVVNKAVNKLLNMEETKQAVTTISPAAGYASAQNPTIRYINHVAIGTGINQRVGQKIRLKKLTIRGSMANGSATGPSQARLVLFWDSQNNGTLPVNADLMQDTTAATNFNSPYLITNRKRFHVVYDKQFAFNNHGGSTDQAEVKKFKITKNFKKGHLIQYNTGTAATQADSVGGSFFSWFSTDSAAGQPFLSWDVEYLYKDA